MVVRTEGRETTPVRILVADDSQLMRRCLRTLLEQQDRWTVCGEASNGQEAIERAQQAAPDIIVLDFQMPKMNGLDVAREIRKMWPEIPILMVTLHMSPQLEDQAKKIGIKVRATRGISIAWWKAWTRCCTVALIIQL